MKKIVVMISGSGTNLQALIDSQAQGFFDGKIVGVISNKADAFGLTRAANAGIPTFVFTRKQFESNAQMDEAIAAQIDALEADLIVCAGYMKILTPAFTQRFEGKVLNIHPSLLPKFPGLDTFARAVEAGETEHGMTIHFINEEVDAGAIILQARVPIYPEDSLDDIADRVHEQEHRCYPLVVKWFCADRLQLDAGNAYLDGEALPAQGYAMDSESAE